MSINDPSVSNTTPIISNKTYNILKWFVMVFLPAFAALYFGLSTIWGLPYGEQVVGTVSLVTVFLGALLQLSTNQYNKSDAKYDGIISVDTSGPTKDIYSFEVHATPDEIQNKKELTVKVVPPA